MCHEISLFQPILLNEGNFVSFKLVKNKITFKRKFVLVNLIFSRKQNWINQEDELIFMHEILQIHKQKK